MKSKSIKIASIHATADMQSRATINRDTVDNYAERMAEGDKFPPIVLFKYKPDSAHAEEVYFLGDGFHRLAAAIKNGFVDILAEVRDGSQLDALKYSIASNRTNGLSRSNADKRRAVCLGVQFFGDLSNRAIAELVGVSDPFVGKVREDYDAEKAAADALANANASQPAEPAPKQAKKRKGRDGVVREVKPAAPAPSPESASAAAPEITADVEFSPEQVEPAPAAQSEPAASAPVESQIVAGMIVLWGQASPAERYAFREFVKTQV